MSLKNHLKKGISVIIPTYQSEKYIAKLLDSLVTQTIDFNLFEAIFVVNGNSDRASSIIKDYQEKFPDVNIVMDESDKGVSNARNRGIQLADYEYSIFIDDDDYVSENYLESLYEYAKPDRIVIGTFFDVDLEGNVSESYLTAPLLEKSGVINNPYDFMRDILVITTDKLIPTEYVKKSAFNQNLNNGVDISYYANFYTDYDFEFFVVDKKLGANYYRLWRKDSISRRAMSYEFNITDRLKVIKDINHGLKKAKNPTMKSFVQSLTGGQVVKINQYLAENPKDYTRVLNDILSYNFDFFPYKYLNEDIALLDNDERELIISYAFSPVNTTTSNVVAKRILSEKKNVDVVCASLNNLNKDYTLEKMVSQFVVNRFTVEDDFNITWDSIKNFKNRGLEKLGKYNKIYSRANFVHSHFLALEYKLLHPDTYWRAEFSDPLIYTFFKKHLSTKINDEEYVRKCNLLLDGEKLEHISADDDINCICEYLTFVFADEIIFTNQSQMEVMINTLPFEIEGIIREKSVISPHPTLDEKYYFVFKSEYNVDKEYINIAYFGEIFPNRSFEDFINAYDNISSNGQDKIKLHIFTSSKTLFEQVLSQKLYKNTIINESVDYLEFLNLTNKFDILIVEDSYTQSHFILNPYLPSKISDYKGSSSKIWAICERGSEMDKLECDFKSYIDDINSGVSTLNSITGQSQTKLNDEYFRTRISHLTQKIYELISVCELEFSKDNQYEARIEELNQIIEELENENIKIKNSNSWKITGNFRKIRKKFK